MHEASNFYFQLSTDSTRSHDMIYSVYKEARNNVYIFNMSELSYLNSHECFAEALCMYENGETLPKYIQDLIPKGISYVRKYAM